MSPDAKTPEMSRDERTARDVTRAFCGCLQVRRINLKGVSSAGRVHWAPHYRQTHLVAHSQFSRVEKAVFSSIAQLSGRVAIVNEHAAGRYWMAAQEEDAM